MNNHSRTPSPTNRPNSPRPPPLRRQTVRATREGNFTRANPNFNDEPAVNIILPEANPIDISRIKDLDIPEITDPISTEIISDPVRINAEPQVFDRSSLEELISRSIAENKIILSPMTRAKIISITPYEKFRTRIQEIIANSNLAGKIYRKKSRKTRKTRKTRKSKKSRTIGKSRKSKKSNKSKKSRK